MMAPEEYTRIVAAEPIEVGEVRVLPSVMVKNQTRQWDQGGGLGWFRMVFLRPVSVVVEGPRGAEWHEIPYAERDALTQMATAAGVMAAVGLAALALIGLLRRR